jgi:hypothetical protein
MLVEKLFERDIFRPINGVVKADQLDDSSVWQELDEFVITRELDRHLRQFISWYLEAADEGAKGNPTGKMGIWIGGYFGSGKSHLLKVLFYLLQNAVHRHGAEAKKTVEFFESKIKDEMFIADIKRAVAAETDVVLFNIDAKAGHGNGSGRDLILRVFLKVLNELQGYSGDHPHIAHMERFLDSKGKLKEFEEAFKNLTGSDWRSERDAYDFHQDEIVKALGATLGQSEEACVRWIVGAENNFTISVENFCKWVKEYLDAKGPKHRIAFLIDEVGQFIGTDSHLMLSLQTITEELGTVCRRRAWVVVTSQEDMDAVLGDMNRVRKQDFSKIQGRFFPPLTLSSANVDEVIQSRLLAKPADVAEELHKVFRQKGDILKNQMSFVDCGMTFKQYKGEDDFAKNYPFAPYQFQLVQKIFESVRRAGATGAHLAKGERSMLDAFQSAAQTVSASAVGVLAPLYDFYPPIESFLDTTVKKTIEQAETNPSLQPFDIKLLQILFLIRYVDEIKGNVNNLVTLCLDQIDTDRLALRRTIEESLGRLEKETLINRNGDVYFFLTNEERDVSKEIKQVDLSGAEESGMLGEILFEDVLKGQRKHRYSVNGKDFDFNRRCDQFAVGQQKDGVMMLSLVSPLGDAYEGYDKSRAIMDSTAEGGCVIVRLGNDEALGRDLRRFLQTDKYVRRKNDGTLSETTKRILRERAEENADLRNRLTMTLGEMFACAEFFVNGQSLAVKAKTPLGALEETMEYLVQNTFTKMSYLKHLSSEPLKEIQSVLRGDDVSKETLFLQSQENNPLALDDVRECLSLSADRSHQVVVSDLLEKRYSLRPFGWPDEEVLLILARLFVLGEIRLSLDGMPLEAAKVYEVITTPARRRKVVASKRETSDPKALATARSLGKELFAEMGPDGEDALRAFLQGKLKDWQDALKVYKPLADTGNYPGGDEIADGLTLISPLLNDADSRKFIERFNTLKDDLLDFGDLFVEVNHFYKHQKAAWESLLKARAAFDLNRFDLEKDDQAGPALRRMQEILSSKAPYGMIKETSGLITTIEAVNSLLLSARRSHALAKIEAIEASLRKDIDQAQGDDTLKRVCLGPVEKLKAQVASLESLAHIAQAEEEAVKAHDAAVARIEAFVAKASEPKKPPADDDINVKVIVGGDLKPAIKKQRVVKPAEFVKVSYLETADDVDCFVAALRHELDAAIKNNERIQIR